MKKSPVLVLLALTAGTAHGHQLRGHISQSGLDFIAEQIPSLVPKDLYPEDITKPFSCMTAIQRDTHLALEVHDFSITIPEPGRLRLYLNVSADGTGELFVDDPFACFGEMTCQNQIMVHDARATFDFDIMLEDGQPSAVFRSVDLQLSEDDIDLNFSGCAADDIANWMIDFAKEYVTGFLLDKAEEMAKEKLGPKVAEMLGGVGVFEGRVGSTDVAAALTDLFVRDAGVELGATVDLTSMYEPAECVREYDTGDPSDHEGDAPSLTDIASHVGLALNFGLVNDALYHVWRRGLTCLTGNHLEALGVHLDTDHILALLPGFPAGSSLDLEMKLTRPPRMQATGGNDDVDSLDLVAVIEGIEVKLIGHLPDGSDKTIDIGMDVRATMALGVDPGTNAMVATPVGVEITRMAMDQAYAAEVGVDSVRLMQVVHDHMLPKMLAKFDKMPVTGPVFAAGEFAVILRGVGNNEAFLSLNADLFRIPANDIGAPETSIIEYPFGPVSPTTSTIRVSGVDGMIPTELLQYTVTINGEAKKATYVRSFNVGAPGESGVYEVQVSALDLSGNSDPTPASVQVTVDGIAPKVVMPGERFRKMDGGSTDLTWTMSDDMTDAALLGARIELYQVTDESDLLAVEHLETIELPPGATSATVAIEDGKMYRAELHVTDAVGNVTVAAVVLDSENACGCSAGGGSTGATTLLLGVGLVGLFFRRRRRA
jgi:MYXO-CTERM domain-containing protein